MRRIILLFALILATSSAFPQSRELRWDELSVKARLDDAGRLHVDETQKMVFTGDWNGGERIFNIRPRQSIALESVGRIDPDTGQEIPLTQGSLSEVDHYDLTDRNVLRWRSRNPSDPPFDRTPITYVLHYTLSNILQRDDDRFVLDHDFAFAQREGPIQRFALDVTLDPAWKPISEARRNWAAGPLPPGESFVVTIPLQYVGSGKPIALDSGVTTPIAAMLGALLLVPLIVLGAALMREKALGRLEPVRPEQITQAWLQQNLLNTRPEVIGALWDENIGASEVSAVLARLVAEKKIDSRVKGKELHITLNVPRQQLEGYERELIDALFFKGDETSTAKIRQHYQNKGFNPTSTITEGLTKLAEERLPKGEKVKVSPILATVIFFAAIAALGYGAVVHDGMGLPAFLFVIVGLFFSIAAVAGPTFWRKRKNLGVIHALLFLIPAALAVMFVAFLVWRSAAVGVPEFPLAIQLGATLMGLWIFVAAVSTLRSRESRESIALRKMLTAARDYFRRELKNPKPALDDAWYPYVLAFGLGRDVERWFKSFPGASNLRDRHVGSSSTSSSSSSSSGTSWTGGGGSFGGAGASGAWVAAASGLAAGVSPPSSSGSSSGGGGGGGGGSSGGGGGGGW